MIRFGIVGTGRISDWILKGAVSNKDFKAVAVCSRSEHTAIAFIKKHPEAFDRDALVFTSVEEMASCGSVDAIYIGTPNNTHHDYAIAALEKGKHVLCEKPMGCSEAEVREMVKTSKKHGAALMEAMISTLNPNFRAARERIGEIGTVRQYFSSFCQYSTRYDALKRGEVSNSFNPQMGGGALEDIGVYTTFPLAALFGEPLSVRGAFSRLSSEYGDINLGGNVILTYPQMSAVLTYSKTVDAHVPTEICGERGNIVLDNIHNCRKAEFAAHAAPSAGRGPGASRETILEGLQEDDYYYEFEEFIGVIKAGKIESETNSHRVSLINARIMDQIRKLY